MTQLSDAFEQSIHRIHELIEQEGSEITWNDRLADPDNPNQPRQVDITIKRDGRLTLIECRLHSRPQDVKWIEELIGRRLSLRADAVIAVSSAGFTRGAQEKAKAFGVILRDFTSLTQEEITAWGHTTRIWLNFFQYQNIQLAFGISRNQWALIDQKKLVRALEDPNQLYILFDAVAQKFDDMHDKYLGIRLKVEATISTAGLVLAGIEVPEIKFKAKITPIKQEIEIASIVAYDAPEKDNLDRDVIVEKVGCGNFEIMQSSNKVAVAVDFSAISPPPNSQFRTVEFDFKRIVTMMAFYPLSLNKLSFQLEQIDLSAYVLEDKIH